MQVNEADIEWTEYDHEEATFRRKELSNAAGGEQLGCSLYELPAGQQSWPYHYHTANEEAMFVLAGEGLVRTERGEDTLETGDFLTFPADESGSHRVINDSDEPLRYLVFSTMNEPDVTVYPEKEMLGVFAGSPPGGRDERSLHGYYPIAADVDYWD